MDIIFDHKLELSEEDLRIKRVILDGRRYTFKELAAKIRISGSTLYLYVVKHKYHIPTIEEYILDHLWLTEHGDSLNAKVYKSANGCRCSKKLIMELTGVVPSSALNLLKNWASGDIDTDELCTPKHMRRTQYINRTKTFNTRNNGPKWNGLSNKDRSHKLDDIASPTQYEKEHLNGYIPSPGLINPAGLSTRNNHRRY